MSRVDVPTMKCDRCGYTTTDEDEVGKFWTLNGMWDRYQGAREEWDLCPHCTKAFKRFMDVEQ